MFQFCSHLFKMDLFALALVLVSFVTLIFYWFIRDAQISTCEFSERNLKYVKIGNLLKATLNKEPIQKIKDEVIKREGPVFGFNMWKKRSIMVADADIIQTVLSKEFTNFSNRREFPGFNKLFNENVAMVQGEQWKRLRAISTPAFSVGKLKLMKPCIDETIQTMLKNLHGKINENQIQNVRSIFDAFTLDTLIQIAFGVKVDSLNEPNNPIIVNGRKIVQTDVDLKDLVKFSLIYLFPKFAEWMDVQIQVDATNFFTKFSLDVMKQKREESAKTKNFSKATSFIEFMMEAEEENKNFGEINELDKNKNPIKKPTKYMTKDEIISQCILFFIAGFDTTETALTLSAYNLACNPETQEKLYQEINSVLDELKQETPDESDPFKLVTYEALPKFEYLSAVVNESLRINPPAIFIERKVENDMKLSNPDGSIHFNVKNDDVIHIPIYSIHRNPKYFPEPEKFKPERFIGEPKFHKYAYLPFGSGPRNCIAKSMALMEAKLALLHVIRDYKFEVCEQTKIPLEFVNVLDSITPRDAFLRIVKRV